MPIFYNKQLITDRDLANAISMSASWVRKQRWLRKHRYPHILDIDAITIGSAVRYRTNDVMAWMERGQFLGAEN